MQRFSARRWRRAVVVCSIVLLAVGGAVGDVRAGVESSCDKACTALGYDSSVKIEDPSGEYQIDHNGLVATFTVGSHPDVSAPEPNNAVLSFVVSSGSSVTSGTVIVKGGNDSTAYSFDDATPFHAPAVSSGKWPEISHVVVCFDRGETPVVGRLEVTKDVEGVEVPDGSFEVCVAPAGGGTPTCRSVAGDATVAFENLAPGGYVVTETHPGATWTVSGSPQNVTVTAGGTATAVVTNTWVSPPDEDGRVVVIKAVTGTGAPPGATFQVCLEPVGDTTGERVCFEELVGAGETATFVVPAGTYQVVEPALAAAWTMTSDPSVVVEAGGTAAVTLTNAYEPPVVPPTKGSVVVTKVVAGSAGTETYELCLVGPGSSTASTCTTLRGAGEVRFDDLVPGTYTVTEPGRGGATDVEIVPASVTVVAGGTAAATVTNGYPTEQVLPPAEPPATPAEPAVTPAAPAAPASAPAAPAATPAAPAATPAAPAAATGALPAELPVTGVEGGLAMLGMAFLAGGSALLALGRRHGEQPA